MTYEEWLDSLRDLGFIPLPHEHIEPGDSYIAERNTGPQLLTCQRVVDTLGYIVPVENAYYFDTWECVKVTLP